MDKGYGNDKEKLKCAICGQQSVYICQHKVGDINCDTPLCDQDVCQYIHLIKSHGHNKNMEEILKRYECKIDNATLLAALNKEILKSYEKYTEYKKKEEKFPQKEVKEMFCNLAEQKKREIYRFKDKIKERESM